MGHPAAPSFVDCITNNGERKIEIFAADLNPENLIQGLFKKMRKVSPFTSKNYINDIISICKKDKIDIFWARNEIDTLLVNEFMGEFEEIGTKVMVAGSSKNLGITNNKGSFCKFFKKNSIPCAKFQVVNNFTSLKKSILDFNYPGEKVIVKPTLSIGGRGTFVVSPTTYSTDKKIQEPMYSLESLEKIFSKIKEKTFPELIVMEYLPGTTYSVDVLSRNGKSIYIVPKIRLSGTASNTMIGKIDLNQNIIKYVSNVVKRFDFNYIQNYELKLNKNGEPIIFDINPRGGASVAFCKAAGVNLPYFAIKMALKEKFPEKLQIKNNLKMIRGFKEYYE